MRIDIDPGGDDGEYVSKVIKEQIQEAVKRFMAALPKERPECDEAGHAWRCLRCGVKQTVPKGRRRITDEFLHEVAAVYRRSVDGGAPTQAVAQEKSVSHSTAARYVAQARQRGFLGRTKPGRPGETEEQ